MLSILLFGEFCVLLWFLDGCRRFLIRCCSWLGSVRSNERSVQYVVSYISSQLGIVCFFNLGERLLKSIYQILVYFVFSRYKLLSLSKL